MLFPLLPSLDSLCVGIFCLTVPSVPFEASQATQTEIQYGVVLAQQSRTIQVAGSAYVYMLPDDNRADFLQHGGPLPLVSWQTDCRQSSTSFAPPLQTTPLPDFSNTTPSLEMPFVAGCDPLPPPTRTFHIAGNDADGFFTGYTAITAHQVAASPHYRLYSEGAGFSTSQFQSIVDKLESTRAARFDRHGPTSDVDGNGLTIIVMSATASDVRSFGESWVDGADFIGLEGTDYGEIIYGMWLPGAGVDFYQRNFMHEETHLAQLGWSILQAASPEEWQVQSPFLGPIHTWEIGDVGHPVSGISTTPKQSNMAVAFQQFPKQSGPYWFPFDFGAYVSWVASDLFGEGYAEHLTPGLYDLTVDDPYDVAVPGLTEPMLQAIAYASIVQDGQAVLAVNNLQISDWDVLPGLRSAIRVTPCTGPFLFERHTTTAAILRVDQPLVIEIKQPSRDLFVMVVE